jgi:hypothetical protein
MTGAVLVPLSTRLARAQRFGATRGAYAKALRHSGALGGAPRALPYDAWPRDALGAPAAVSGWTASLADTTGLAAGLVARGPVGLDVEWRFRPRWEAARVRFDEAGELARLGADDKDAVLALWCAKEAPLKLARTGIADLGRCRLIGREGERFLLEHAGTRTSVRVRLHGAHWIACAGGAGETLELVELQEVS